MLPTVFKWLALAALVVADIPTCGGGRKCGQDSPCCSQYGQCGVGAYCLGGCDPINSFSLDACMPAPVCQSSNSVFGKNYKGVVSKSAYLGDASKADWVAEGQPTYTDDEMLLTMPPESVGTLVASTHYVWFGKITAKLRTSHGAGVVTAFILLSDVKDEIDYEFVGTQLETAQTNWYYNGIPDYTHSANISLSDTYAAYHIYTIDWQPDSITWSVDGQVGRTLKRADTWNSTSNRYDFPQSPARVQLSLWPGGASTNAKGTVDWAGGPINWQSPLMQPQNYYYAAFQYVNIECYDTPAGARVSGSKSYVITDSKADNTSFQIVDKSTVMKSFLGTGLKPDTGAPSGTPSNLPETIPGLTGGGSGTAIGGGAKSGGSSSSGDSGSGFSQGGTGSGSTNDAADFKSQRVLQGSIFGVIMALSVALLL